MKAVLLLCVLLGAVLSVRAAAVEAVEAAAQNSPDVVLVAENEEEAAPLPEDEPEALAAEEEALAAQEEALAAEEEASLPEGRFFLCPSGWIRYESSCYLYVSSGRSWTSAAANCAALGASLPAVHSSWEYSFLQELTTRGGGSVAWVGGFYFLGWRWLDQSSWDYSNWNSQNSVSRYQCMYLNARAGWSNHNCGNGWPSICVRRTNTC